MTFPYPPLLLPRCVAFHTNLGKGFHQAEVGAVSSGVGLSESTARGDNDSPETMTRWRRKGVREGRRVDEKQKGMRGRVRGME